MRRILALAMVFVFAISAVATAEDSDDVMVDVFAELEAIPFTDPNFQIDMQVVVDDGLDRMMEVDPEECTALRWANHTAQLHIISLFLNPEFSEEEAGAMLVTGSLLSANVPPATCTIPTMP